MHARRRCAPLPPEASVPGCPRPFILHPPKFCRAALSRLGSDSKTEDAHVLLRPRESRKRVNRLPAYFTANLSPITNARHGGARRVPISWARSRFCSACNTESGGSASSLPARRGQFSATPRIPAVSVIPVCASRPASSSARSHAVAPRHAVNSAQGRHGARLRHVQGLRWAKQWRAPFRSAATSGVVRIESERPIELPRAGLRTRQLPAMRLSSLGAVRLRFRDAPRKPG